MPEYLVAFNGEWVPEHTEDEILAKSRALRPLLAEMRAANVLIFTGGLVAAACGWPQEVSRFQVPRALPEDA